MDLRRTVPFGTEAAGGTVVVRKTEHMADGSVFRCFGGVFVFVEAKRMAECDFIRKISYGDAGCVSECKSDFRSSFASADVLAATSLCTF